MSIRILHTADLHLGAEYKSFHTRSEDLQQEAFSAFEKLINYTIDPVNGIDILIIAGDLFDDHQPDLSVVEKVKEQLLKVVKKERRLYILPGNHDSYSYKNSIYRTAGFPGTLISSPDFELVDEIRIKNAAVYIYSGLYEINNPEKRILNNFKIIPKPGIHIGILHGTLDLKEIMVPERALPFSFKEFKDSGLNYLALGHFHTFKEKESDNEHKLAYPGSFIPRSIDEYGDKYSLIVEIKQKGFVQIDKLQFSKVKVEKKVIDLIKIEISDAQDLIDLLKRSKDTDLILDLYLEGVLDFSINEEELKKMMEDYFYYIKINNNIKYIDSSIITQLEKEETIRGLFFKKMIEKSAIISDKKKSIINQAVNLGLRDFTQTGFYKKDE